MVIRRLRILRHMVDMRVPAAAENVLFFGRERIKEPLPRRGLGLAAHLFHRAPVQRLHGAIPGADQLFPHKKLEHGIPHKGEGKRAHLLWIAGQLL